MARADPFDQATARRALDANANRAGEALRVLEDLSRFGPAGGRSAASGALKRMRHGLRRALAAAGPSRAERVLARDVATDPGRRRPVEGPHAGLPALAAANWRRLAESLRSLEEFSRLRSVAAARAFAALRFEAYALEQAWEALRLRRARIAPVRLYLIATPRQGRPLLPAVRAAARAGVGMVQLRIKGGSDRRILGEARRLLPVLRRHGVLLLVNDRPDLAALAGADGVHLGQDDLPVAAARRIVGEGAVIGVSTHSVAQAVRAARGGADYVGFGPLYATPTKPGRRPIGLAGLRAVRRRLGIPVFAIGGVRRGTLAAALRAGADRVSVSSAVLDSPDPGRETRTLLRMLRKESTGPSRAARHEP